MYTLMTPGPVPLAPSVQNALSAPLLHHRTPEFEQILARVLHNLPFVFQTKQHCCLITCTGTGVMEAALVNTLSPGARILAICAGKFGARWADMAKAYGLDVTRIEVPWGRDPDIADIAQTLQKQNFAALLMQACETSTGSRLPVQEVSQLVRSKHPNTLLLVDAITALGAYDIPMDEWGLDVVIGGAQKALMAPTGLGLIALSARAWQKCESATCLPRYYWDLSEEKKANRKTQTRFSSAVTLITALDESLKIFKSLGLPRIFARTANLSTALTAGFKELGFNSFPKSPSPSLSCLATPAGLSAQALRTALEVEYKITLMAGQDHLQDQVLRVGHMGYIQNADALRLLTHLGSLLQKMRPQDYSSARLSAAIETTKTLLGPEIL